MSKFHQWDLSDSLLQRHSMLFCRPQITKSTLSCFWTNAFIVQGFKKVETEEKSKLVRAASGYWIVCVPCHGLSAAAVWNLQLWSLVFYTACKLNLEYLFKRLFGVYIFLALGHDVLAPIAHFSSVFPAFPTWRPCGPMAATVTHIPGRYTASSVWPESLDRLDVPFPLTLALTTVGEESPAWSEQDQSHQHLLMA